jgi:thimet oligopeptidase
MNPFLAAATLTAAALLSPLATAADTRPLVPLWDIAQINSHCDSTLADAAAAVKKMESKKTPGGVFGEWNRLQIEIEDVMGPVYLLANVHTDKAVRDAGDACVLRLTKFQTDLYQNEKLYQRIQAAEPATAAAIKLRKDLIEGFEDTGVTLPPDQRRRAKEIIDKIEDLRQVFDRNVRDDKTKVVMTPAEMKGMPEAYVKAQKKDEQGNYVLGLDYPAYVPFLMNAASGEARQRFWMAKQREGGEANLAIIDQIMGLRLELAKLYGLNSYGEYSIRRKMAEHPDKVLKFLVEVKDAVREVEKKELEELRAEKARDTGKPLQETKLNRWDVSYYQEKVKKARFSIDQEALRKNFPTDKAVAFALLVSERLYGVKFKRVDVPVWHQDVTYYDVLDAKTGKFISGFYLDLFPREGKYGHAAAFPVRGVSRLAKRTPVSVLVTNFNRAGLDFNEMETLMHEFGHVLHGVLSVTDYNPHAGTSTLVDFVEAPSQMFEEWVRSEQSLALFKQVCPECPALSKDEIKRLDDARNYGKGIQYARQWLYASFDMALVSAKPEPAMAVWKRMESETPLGHVEGSLFPASFSHIAGGYAAGYYGYMWSQVIALDMLSKYGDNLLDAKVGKHYRETILAQGGQVHPAKLVRKFLGREPNSKAFFEEITGKR